MGISLSRSGVERQAGQQQQTLAQEEARRNNSVAHRQISADPGMYVSLEAIGSVIYQASIDAKRHPAGAVLDPRMYTEE